MAPTVSVTKAVLRRGLLGFLSRESTAVGHAWPLSEEERDNIRWMRAHHEKAKALGALLDEVGWRQDDLRRAYELDVDQHGWAAAGALRFLIWRERSAAIEFAVGDEPEAAGVAGGHRLDAERELAHIEAACGRAGRTISKPEP